MLHRCQKQGGQGGTAPPPPPPPQIFIWEGLGGALLPKSLLAKLLMQFADSETEVVVGVKTIVSTKQCNLRILHSTLAIDSTHGLCAPPV